MSKQNNRRGFTITELIIVIVVIAILAAVLIPTFISLIDKANMSADEQAVRQMNTVLAAEEAIDGKAANVTEVQTILMENGISDFIPMETRNTFYWCGADNRVLLWTADEMPEHVEGEEADIGKVTYPKEQAKKYASLTSPSADWAKLDGEYDVQIIEPAEGQTIGAALLEAIDGAENGAIIQLPADSVVDIGGNAYFFESYMKQDGGTGKEVTIDLNGSTLVSDETFVYNGTDYGYYGLTIPANGSLELIDGSVEITTDYSYLSAITVKSGGHLVLRDVDVTSNGSALYPVGTGSEIVLDGCNISGGDYGISTNGAESNLSRIMVKDSTVKGKTGLLINATADVHVENSTIQGKGWGMLVRVGHVDVINSTISTTDGDVGSSNGYKNFAYTQNSRGVPYWGTGYQVPYGVVVLGDYYGRDSYVGEVIVDFTNVSLVTPNATDVPNVLYAAQDAADIVTFGYDATSSVGKLVLFGEDFSRSGVTHTFVHNGIITVNGAKKN